MKTKLFFAATLLIASVACNKEECYECHYDGPNGEEVELEVSTVVMQRKTWRTWASLPLMVQFMLFTVVSTKILL